MGALRKTHHRSKKINPYAERGLDKFALLSAELEEKREKLVSQLGNPASVVRFEVGSDRHDWIPVIACPTLASTEISVLKGAATRLSTADHKPAIISSANAVVHKHGDTHAGSILAQDITSRHADQLSDMADPDAEEDPHTCCSKTGAVLCRLRAASERFLWMAGFILSIAADIFRSLLFFKGQVADVAASSSRLVRSYSSWRPREAPDHSSAAGTPSSPRSPSLPTSPAISRPPSSTQSSINLPLVSAPASFSADHSLTATADTSHLPAQTIEAHKLRNRQKNQGAAGKKSLQETVSFPTRINMQRLQDEVPLSSSASDKKGSKFRKSVSLPYTAAAQSHGLSKLQTVLRSPASLITRESTAESKKAQQERLVQINLGQALTGAGLAIGLGGLVIGLVPAILCIVCWWYGLPSMRRALGGDKPHLKSRPSSRDESLKR